MTPPARKDRSREEKSKMAGIVHCKAGEKGVGRGFSRRKTKNRLTSSLRVDDVTDRALYETA